MLLVDLIELIPVVLFICSHFNCKTERLTNQGMKKILYCLLVLAIVSCQKTEPDPVAPTFPEYPDWYTFVSPEDRAVESVWGDIDKTLLLSTMFTIYRSTDRGKTWQSVRKQQLGMFGVVQHQDTLFTMSGLANQSLLIHPDNYSVDDGKTWRPYARRNPVFEYPSRPGMAGIRFAINPVAVSNGTSYEINRVFLDDPVRKVGRFETPGVITSAGRRIDLPQLHQLTSLYVDANERLYIAGSDAVCGNGQNFAFCNSKGGRGVVYVSKRPRP